MVEVQLSGLIDQIFIITHDSKLLESQMQQNILLKEIKAMMVFLL